MGEPMVVISVPNLPGLFHVPGSVERKCGFCDRKVGVSPACIELVERGEGIPACPICVLANADPDIVPGITPEVRKEIEDRSGRTPEAIMGHLAPTEALSMLADRVVTIEGRIERGEISG